LSDVLKENDIAIITLDTPVTMTEDVALVCLTPKCFNSDDAEGMTMGWGHYKLQGMPPTAIGLDFWKAMNEEKCNAHLKAEELPSSMVCAIPRFGNCVVSRTLQFGSVILHSMSKHLS
jgi:hypothetical protein